MKRRDFLKWIGVGSAALVAAGPGAATFAKPVSSIELLDWLNKSVKSHSSWVASPYWLERLRGDWSLDDDIDVSGRLLSPDGKNVGATVAYDLTSTYDGKGVVRFDGPDLVFLDGIANQPIAYCVIEADGHPFVAADLRGLAGGDIYVTEMNTVTLSINKVGGIMQRSIYAEH